MSNILHKLFKKSKLVNEGREWSQKPIKSCQRSLWMPPKNGGRNHLSVFFAKIIRLLRKLFNDLSLTRTRFGRRLLSYRTGTCAIFTTSQKQYNYQTSPAAQRKKNFFTAPSHLQKFNVLLFPRPEFSA